MSGPTLELPQPPKPHAQRELLCGANGPNAHAHAQGICTALDQILGLLLRHHIPSHHINVWKLLLDPPGHPGQSIQLALQVGLSNKWSRSAR